ncbi:intracellular protein transport protein USO1-like [Chrysoperla carnea]|uniref:intracellular protein transport protein USO1-like n=1 Tax=Chrysoperla carnea TaxID=189513 RepID=UPI001D077B8E|nr:intracellular protein transport protein USO1-like [Chrysoperla carnea]XP_044736313.1 intracellular protein transport protein USO1-like [Chrysoperla carnea]XP_044736314.1 intracellular protein transport protein USO1-like [Chrysoperla carnea]XP_044736315.1 intracellular protein transport protein USO1-like [Chrysoperla carnea]
MAFSKAKLTRFNDVISDTPAPGRYNPKHDKYARSCTPTSERGDLNKSPISSVASEKNSVISTPCFRTPNLPARRKLLCSQSARKFSQKENLQPTPVSQQLLDQQREELQERIVECNNKTQCIKDLEIQIEELKEQISNLKQNEMDDAQELEKLTIQIDELLEEKQKLIEEIGKIQVQHQNDIHEIKALLADTVDEKDTLIFENEEHQIEICELQKSNDELEIENYELQLKLRNKNIIQNNLIKQQKRFQLLMQKMKAKQKNITFLRKRIMTLRKELCDLKTETHTEISSLQQQLIAAEAAKNKEREETETGFLEVIQQLRSTNNEILKNHKKEMTQFKDSTHQHLRQIQENANLQIRELQTQLDENLKKHEMETKNLKLILSDTERDLQHAIDGKEKLDMELGQKKCVINELQRKLSSTIIELNEVRENWSKEISELRTEIDNINNQKRRYAIALDETRSTVQVITDRLVESDQGVEQLKNQVEKLQLTKIQIENENNELKKKTKELEELYTTSSEKQWVQMEKMIRDDIDKEKRELTDAVENYKQLTLNTIKDYELKQQTLISSLNETNMKYKSLEEKYNELHKTSTKKIQTLEQECMKHKNNNKELLDQLKSREQKFLEAQSLISASKIEIEHQSSENIELKFKVNRLESQIASLQVPMDKSKINKLIEENKKLKNQMKNIEELPEFRELLDKYKQLNMQVNKEKKDKQDMENKIRAQNKLIEKLKQEVTSPKSASRRSKLLVSNEKENQSPGKVAVIRTDSPNTTPLKDRNIRQ